jgi:bis(5'-nucleosyl)-tetraphosphatase (symmetrical)
VPTYAIGDVQGCFDELQQLLTRFSFDKDKDRLWFVGDLVNRGPKSLDTLRLVRQLGDRAIVVLGNHDLHLVSQHEGFERTRKDDTFQDVLDAPDRRELVDWLRQRPMMHVEGGWAMVHAGLLPQWSVAKAPEKWSEALAGWDRLRVIVNAMTRMRFCTPQGKMEFKAKGQAPPPGYRPWYELRDERESIVYGHWSAAGLQLNPRTIGLDTACVWGGQLTALRLEDRALFRVPCRGYQAAGGSE